MVNIPTGKNENRDICPVRYMLEGGSALEQLGKLHAHSEAVWSVVSHALPRDSSKRGKGNRDQGQFMLVKKGSGDTKKKERKKE